ncbi:endonuclease III [Candidatus Woesearchaeota archaeon]|nr:endonuclease III [Candidatus Woesearchaeota archaeon]
MLAKRQGSTMLGRMGQKYEPFKVLISTILSARAKDEVTEVLAENLFKKYPDATSLAKAKPSDVKKIIRKIGFFNAKTKNVIGAAKMLLSDFEGKVPDTLEQLIELPGVGRKVANCVLVYSFAKDAIPVDIHVHRISNRLGWVKTGQPEETEQRLMTFLPRKHWQILNDTLVSHGKTICAPISPKCSQCPIAKHCKRVGVTSTR